MGIIAVWFMLVIYIAWKGGLSDGMMPAPYRFWGASGSMAFAALIGLLNDRVGTLVAVALALGAVFYYQGQPPRIGTGDALSFGAVSATSGSITPKLSNPTLPGIRGLTPTGPSGSLPGLNIPGKTF